MVVYIYYTTAARNSLSLRHTSHRIDRIVYFVAQKKALLITPSWATSQKEGTDWYSNAFSLFRRTDTHTLTFVQNLRGNSRTYTYVEVSRHNLESSQTWGFYQSFCLSTRCYSRINLSFLHWLIVFVWISETIGVVWFYVRFFCLFYNYKCCM